MTKARLQGALFVDCRIGSLEMSTVSLDLLTTVDCRIGSLEKIQKLYERDARVDCRIGSLETDTVLAGAS